HPKPSMTFGRGKTFLDRFHADQFSEERQENLYYPFLSREEWQFAAFLERCSLSNQEIDELLALDLMKQLPLSFRNATQLRGRIELLPAGPQWHYITLTVDRFPTKKPIRLFYRDGIDCLEFLFGNPAFKGHMDFDPRRDVIPAGATLAGVVLSSDKTMLTNGSGNRVAHPLLMSLANIHLNVRMKSSQNSMLLAALLPCPEFLCAKPHRGVLESRVFHRCVDIVCRPLKMAASMGRMMVDPAGYSRFCFTPLVAYIVDNPEAQLIACVGGKNSALTTAMYKQFGDPFPHQARTAATTLNQIKSLAAEAPDPWDLPTYVRKAKEHRLNGVSNPFWRDWPLSDPSAFLTPEPLHQWHKMCWDHDINWCRQVVGSAELDFRYSVLQPRIGFRHFGDGISHLKQVTGREHRDIQRYLVGCIAGAAPGPFVTCIRVLADFRYLAQAPVITDDVISRLDNCLKVFHENKQCILELGARRGKGNKLISDWYIPKLELMQSVTRSIRLTAAPIQWTADVTEHSHIAFVKAPFRRSNRRDYDPQICCALDRAEKCHLFDLATSMCETVDGLSSDDDLDLEDDDEAEEGSDACWDTSQVVDNDLGARRPLPDYFALATSIKHRSRVFATSSTAFRLNYRSKHNFMTINDAAILFNVPDLQLALVEYIQRCGDTSTSAPVIGGRRGARAGKELPFDSIEIWYNVRVQTKSPYDPTCPTQPQNIQAQPPSTTWPHGRHDSVMVISDMTVPWPVHADIQLIFRPLAESTVAPYLAYAYRFDFLSQGPPAGHANGVHQFTPDPTTGLYILRKATRSDGSRMGGIIPLSQIRMPVQLIPRFGKVADSRMDAKNSLACCQDFYLNHYVDKDTF
ncbi:hypothetical protein DENSPDRAFT_750630, partial [Dentipellis sp. KUC8613]